MRKNDLIAKLQAIEGNPVIGIWFEGLGDYQNILTVIPVELGRMCKDSSLKSYNNERLRDGLPEMTKKEFDKAFKPEEWEVVNNDLYRDEEKKKMIFGKNLKTMYCIAPKLRNKKTFCRIGDINY